MLSLMVVITSTYAIKANRQTSQLASQQLEVTKAQAVAAQQSAALANVLSMIDDATETDGTLKDEVLFEAALICAVRFDEPAYAEMAIRFIVQAFENGVFEDEKLKERLLKDIILNPLRTSAELKQITKQLSEE